MNKKGAEVWQIVLIILALALFIFMAYWYSTLDSAAGGLLDKLGGLF